MSLKTDGARLDDIVADDQRLGDKAEELADDDRELRRSCPDLGGPLVGGNGRRAIAPGRRSDPVTRHCGRPRIRDARRAGWCYHFPLIVRLWPS